MKILRLKAPAKLNLFLKVLRKRPDNYHDIFSLFHKVKLADELTFRPIVSSECRVITSCPNLPIDERNLIVRAYNLMHEMARFEGGIEVEVKKNIPLGGGMGGGSSDAAATIKAINRIFSLKLKPNAMSLIGLELGADVPFFLEPCTSALVTGIGEKISVFKDIGSFYFLLVFFPEEVSTRSAYEALALKPKKTGVSIPKFHAKLQTVQQLKRCFANDLMSATFKMYPLVKKVHHFISRLNFAACQTGSGPTLFVVDRSREELERLSREVSKTFKLKTQLTKTL